MKKCKGIEQYACAELIEKFQFGYTLRSFIPYQNLSLAENSYVRTNLLISRLQTSPLTLQYGFDQMDTYSEIMCICAMCVCLDDKNDYYDAFKFFLFSIIAVTVSEYIYMHMVSFLSFSRSID